MKTVFKIAAVLLLALSLAMFFLPWARISFSVDGRSYTLQELINKNDGLVGSSFKELKKMLRESLKNTEENFAEENIDFDSKRLMSAIEALADSSITPLDLTRAAGSLSMTANASKMIYEKDQRTDAESYESVAELHKYAQAATVGLWILLGGAALTFLLAVFAALTGKKLGALPYVLVTLLLSALFIAGVALGNTSISEIDEVDELLDTFSHYGVDIDPQFLHVALPCILALVFAVGGLVFCILAASAPRTEKSAAKRTGRAAPEPELPTEKWTCTSCGTVMSMSTSYCLNCGAKRPLTARCPICAAPLSEDDLFCPNCGATIKSTPAVKPNPAPMTCKSCGWPLKDDDAFCPNCGAPVGAAPEAAGPKHAALSCPACGEPLKDDDAFCPNCGAAVKAAPAAKPAAAPRLISSFRPSEHEPAAPVAETNKTKMPEGFSLPDDSDL